MHSLKAGIMSLVILAMLAAPSLGIAQNCGPAPCIGIADFDSDGFLTALDLGSDIDFLFAGGSEPVFGIGDLDGDGFGTALDLGFLIDVLFAGKPAVWPAREIILVGRSGAGTTMLLCDDAVTYIIGDPINGGTYNVGTDDVAGDIDLVDACPKTDTLIIAAGTKFKGSPSLANPSAFVVRRTGYVHAVGLPNDPIVFGSNNAPGARARGDWGGVVINGCACNNNQPNGYIVDTEGDGGIGGGNDLNDNSGCFDYIRVEFAGREFTIDNELNGISLTSVGGDTKFEHIQVNQNFDDGIEWFGGRVDVKYSVVSGCGDDGFDSDFGAQWRGQYLIVVRDPLGVNSTNYNGFEWDNQPAAPYQDCPRMKPTIFNATLVGAGCDVSLDRHDGAHIRRGADADINNTVWTEWYSALEYDDASAWDNAGCDPQIDCYTEIALPGNPDSRIEIDHSIWYEVFKISGNATTASEIPYMPASVGGAHPSNVYLAEGCGNPSILVQVATYDGVTPLDFRPIAGDPQGIGINAAGAVPPLDGWFDPAGAAFKGALMENDPSPWYSGWTDFSVD